MDKFYILLLLIPVAHGQIFNVCEGKDCGDLECREKKDTGCPSNRETCQHECFDPCDIKEIQCRGDQTCERRKLICVRAPCPKQGTCIERICPKDESPHPVVESCIPLRGGRTWCPRGYSCYTNADGVSTCCGDPCNGQCGPDEYCDKDVPCSSQFPWNLGRPCGHVCRVNKCREPLQPGPCRGSFPRFYYDSTTGLCKPFIYGGCGGNGNNYEKIEDCMKQCRASPLSICHLPEVRGPCEALVPRYFYNPQTRRCEPFIYGGCDGNANNFVSKFQCWRMCQMPWGPRY